MRKFSMLLAIALSGFGNPAFAEWPFDEKPKAVWPFSEKACDCNPCTCDPKTCTCANCEVGCKRSAAQAPETVAFVGEANYFVANPDVQKPADPFAAFAQPATTVSNSAPVGYHLERRITGCDRGQCQVSYVTVPDFSTTSVAPAQASFAYSAGTVADTSCATCGASQGQACGVSAGTGSAFMSRGPVRRIISRVLGR